MVVSFLCFKDDILPISSTRTGSINLDGLRFSHVSSFMLHMREKEKETNLNGSLTIYCQKFETVAMISWLKI